MLERNLAPVLLVEDTEEDVDTLHEVLAASGYPHPLVHAESGEQCLALLRGIGRAPIRPALILLDLNSYGLDGRETLTVLKGDPALKDIPVIVLTTSANPQDLAFCYQMGVNAYHVKPLRHDDHRLLLGDLLKYWLRSVALQPAGVPH